MTQMLRKAPFHNTPLLFISLTLILLAMACRTSSSGKSNLHDDFSKSNDSPKLLFLSFSMKRDSIKGTYSIRLINKMIVNGTMKKDIKRPELPLPGDMKVVSMGSSGNAIDSLVVPDPLYMTAEYLDASNSLRMQEILRDSSVFSVRIQLRPQIISIGVLLNSESSKSNNYLLITGLDL
jgi:hypothetical protein